MQPQNRDAITAVPAEKNSELLAAFIRQVFVPSLHGRLLDESGPGTFACCISSGEKAAQSYNCLLQELEKRFGKGSDQLLLSLASVLGSSLQPETALDHQSAAVRQLCQTLQACMEKEEVVVSKACDEHPVSCLDRRKATGWLNQSSLDGFSACCSAEEAAQIYACLLEKLQKQFEKGSSLHRQPPMGSEYQYGAVRQMQLANEAHAQKLATSQRGGPHVSSSEPSMPQRCGERTARTLMDEAAVKADQSKDQELQDEQPERSPSRGSDWLSLQPPPSSGGLKAASCLQPLTESGFRSVAARKSHAALEAYVEKVVASQGGMVVSKAGLEQLVLLVQEEGAVRSFSQLNEEIEAVMQKPGGWVQRRSSTADVEDPNGPTVRWRWDGQRRFLTWLWSAPIRPQALIRQWGANADKDMCDRAVRICRQGDNKEHVFDSVGAAIEWLGNVEACMSEPDASSFRVLRSTFRSSRSRKALLEALKECGGDPDLATKYLLFRPPSLRAAPQRFFRYFDLRGDGRIDLWELLESMSSSYLGGHMDEESIAAAVCSHYNAQEKSRSITFRQFMKKGGFRDIALAHLDCEADVIEGDWVDCSDDTAVLGSPPDLDMGTLEQDGVLGIFFAAKLSRNDATMMLRKRYCQFRRAGIPFQVVFVSADATQAAYDEHVKGMPWPKLPWLHRHLSERLESILDVRTVPALVLMTMSGLEFTMDGLKLIEEDATGEEFPWGLMETISARGSQEAPKVDVWSTMLEAVRQREQLMSGRPSQRKALEAKAVEVAMTVELTEQGYSKVAGFNSNHAMKVFARRILDLKHWHVNNEAEFFKLMWDYSGIRRTQSLQQLLKDFEYAPWIAKPEQRHAFAASCESLSSAEASHSHEASDDFSTQTGLEQGPSAEPPELRLQKQKPEPEGSEMQPQEEDRTCCISTSSVVTSTGSSAAEDSKVGAKQSLPESLPETLQTAQPAAEETEGRLEAADSKAIDAAEEQSSENLPRLGLPLQGEGGPEPVQGKGAKGVPPLQLGIKGGKSGKGLAKGGKTGKGPAPALEEVGTKPAKMDSAPPSGCATVTVSAPAPAPAPGLGSAQSMKGAAGKAKGVPELKGKGPGKGKGKGKAAGPTREEKAAWQGKTALRCRWKRLLSSSPAWEGSLFDGHNELPIMCDKELEAWMPPLNSSAPKTQELAASAVPMKDILWLPTDKDAPAKRRQGLAIKTTVLEKQAPCPLKDFFGKLHSFDFEAIESDLKGMDTDLLEQFVDLLETVRQEEWMRLQQADAEACFEWSDSLEGLFRRLHEVPFFKQRLKAIMLCWQIQRELDPLAERMDKILAGFKEIHGCQVLQSTLLRLLCIGNSINAGDSTFGRADGFDSIILIKSLLDDQPKGVGNVSLLQHVVSHQLSTEDRKQFKVLATALAEWQVPKNEEDDTTSVLQLQVEVEQLARHLGCLERMHEAARKKCIDDSERQSQKVGTAEEDPLQAALPESQAAAETVLPPDLERLTTFAQRLSEHRASIDALASKLGDLTERLRDLQIWLGWSHPSKGMSAAFALGCVADLARRLALQPRMLGRRGSSSGSGENMSKSPSLTEPRGRLSRS